MNFFTACHNVRINMFFIPPDNDTFHYIDLEIHIKYRIENNSFSILYNYKRQLELSLNWLATTKQSQIVINEENLKRKSHETRSFVYKPLGCLFVCTFCNRYLWNGAAVPAAEDFLFVYPYVQDIFGECYRTDFRRDMQYTMWCYYNYIQWCSADKDTRVYVN